LKIIIEKPQPGEEEHIIVKCHNISPELLNVLNTIKVQGNFLIASIGSEIHRIAPSDVFYIETVDNKTFIYCESEVYEIKQKLYELEELNMSDFLKISKSTIVNLSKIKSLIPSMSGRLEAVLSNGERVVISRQYVGDLKKNLGM
jgi:DNA-binding LytR/AlgR family response regulator